MKIAALLSGGVDSAVALKLLQQDNHDLAAFYIKVWLQEELVSLGDCPWEEDLGHVRQICAQLDVPLKVISLQKEYWQKVIEVSLREMKLGRTPNPDFLCNRQIKFGEMLSLVGKDYPQIATGHYAKAVRTSGGVFLKMAKDTIKDQTYFLASLTKKQLSCSVFPLGDYYKTEVRQIAKESQFSNFARKDSQGICFLGKVKFREFVKFHLGTQKGKIVDFHSRKELGEHEGHWFYTIGQRQGLSLSGGPWYVVQKDLINNVIFVNRNSREKNQEKKFFQFVMSHLNQLAELDWEEEIFIKIRHGEKKYLAKISFQNPRDILVTLNEGDQGIAEGQYAVIYQNDICKLSGMIVAVIA